MQITFLAVQKAGSYSCGQAHLFLPLCSSDQRANVCFGPRNLLCIAQISILILITILSAGKAEAPRVGTEATIASR